MFDLGPVERWKDGDVLFAENDAVTMAYAVTADPQKVGSSGWHGSKEIRVEYITPEAGALWDGAPVR